MRRGESSRQPHRGARALRLARLLLAALACAAGLAACASVPSLDEAAARRAQQAGAQASGRDSYDRSQAIVRRLETRGWSGDFLARHLAVEEAVSGAPLTAGNRVRLLPDGPATYRAMRQAIASARRYIHMETYIFEDDDTGALFADALIAKRRQGVEVALMVDAIGTLDTSGEVFRRMRQAGIAVAVFNPVNPLYARSGWSPNRRNHRKLLVVDGEVGYLGGINVSDVYASTPGSGRLGSGAQGSGGGSHPDRGGASRAGAGPDLRSGAQDVNAAGAPQAAGSPWRDTHLEIRGPAVGQMESVFVSAWRQQGEAGLRERQRLEPAPGRGPVYLRILANDPRRQDGYSIYLTLMSAIRSAARSIHVTMAYFVPDPAFIQALCDAAHRGVEVVLVLPGFSDSSLVFHAGRSHYASLLEAGVAIYERRNALLHAKTAVVDGVWATVGSSNMDWRSFALNYEINAVVLGPDFGGEMEALFRKDVAESVRITPGAWRHRPVRDRFMEGVSRLFERWL